MAKVINIMKDVLTLDDMDTETTVSLQAGKFIEVASVRVGAKQAISGGAGEIKLGVDDRETLTFAAKDPSSSAITGKARLVLRDANKQNNPTIQTWQNASLVSGVKLGQNKRAAQEDEYLALEIDPSSDVTFTTANSTLSLPITRFLMG